MCLAIHMVYKTMASSWNVMHKLRTGRERVSTAHTSLPCVVRGALRGHAETRVLSSGDRAARPCAQSMRPLWCLPARDHKRVLPQPLPSVPEPGSGADPNRVPVRPPFTSHS